MKRKEVNKTSCFYCRKDDDVPNVAKIENRSTQPADNAQVLVNHIEQNVILTLFLHITPFK